MDDEPVRLEPWTPDDLRVLERQNSAGMVEYLGGPETDEKVRARHEKFLREQGSVTWPFTIRAATHPDPVGSVVYWQTRHHDEDAYEMGWATIADYQGHGYGTRGIRLALEHAALHTAGHTGEHAAGHTAEHGDRRFVWAFPRTDNLASNAIARAAGFENTGEEDFEYPKGVPITVNAWAFDLDTLR